jgi:hypothetical protein
MHDLQLPNYLLIVVEAGHNLLESVKQVLHLFPHPYEHPMER